MTHARPTTTHLRAVPTAVLAEYFDRQQDMLLFIAEVHGVPFARPTHDEPWTLYHAWSPGFLGAHEADVHAVRRGEVPARLADELASRGWTTPGSPSVDALVQRAITTFPAIQNPAELGPFLAEVAARRPRVVVELGTAAGGVLYGLTQLAHPEATIISVDAPWAPGAELTENPNAALFASFPSASQTLHTIAGDSRHHDTLAELRERLAGRPIDVLLVDGDHSYGGVRSDVELYGPLVRDDGLLALHDICMHPTRWGRGNDVAIYWDELSRARGGWTIIDPHGKLDAPRFDTPVGFEMPALGFGLIRARSA